MAKKARKLLALCLCAILCFSFSTTAFAAGIPYKNFYHPGDGTNSFEITTDRSISQFTVETQNFPTNTSISVEVWNSSKTQQLSSWTVFVYGNDKIPNQLLKHSFSPGTYCIRYSVQPNASGWIGVWLY